MGFLTNIFNKIKKSARNRFIVNKDAKNIQILLNTNDEKYFTLQFEEFTSISHPDSKVISSYSIYGKNKKLGSLYIESIQLSFEYDYSQSIGGYFEYMIKKQLSKEKIEFISSYDSNFYKLTKYMINHEDEIGIIWFNLSDINIFIVDKKGELFNNLCTYFEIKDKKLPIHNKQDYEFEIKTNILKEDIVNSVIMSSN